MDDQKYKPEWSQIQTRNITNTNKEYHKCKQGWSQIQKRMIINTNKDDHKHKKGWSQIKKRMITNTNIDCSLLTPRTPTPRWSHHQNQQQKRWKMNRTIDKILIIILVHVVLTIHHLSYCQLPLLSLKPSSWSIMRLSNAFDRGLFILVLNMLFLMLFRDKLILV